jgi:sulfur relay (sulfurtransferase) DsrC/TusE family protein
MGNGESIAMKINMKLSKKDMSYEECLEVDMTPAQKEVFLIVDEWWKKFGFSPSLRDIAHQRGKMGLGNTSEIVDRLVKVGALKKMKNQGRTIRPVYINFRNLE